MRTGYRHCDPRFPFLWQSPAQPAARWHADGEGPVNYFADTPTGAWAAFLRHEGITDEADLAGVSRALWAVEIPDAPDAPSAVPALPDAQLFGGETTYAACQAEARRLRAAGHQRLEVRGAALLPGQARGWTATGTVEREVTPRDGLVWVLYGPCPLIGWIVVSAGSPPPQALPLVRRL